MADIQVSPATPEEREECFRLAYEVFCEEMGVMREEADHERRILKDEVIDRAHLLCARIDGEIAGTVGILAGTEQPFPEHFERGFEIARFLGIVPRTRIALNIRFLVRRQFRSTPVAFRLILESQSYQIGKGILLTFCDCQPHLLDLYQSLGFRAYAPLFDQPGFGLMAPLMFCLADYGHLRSIRSPILRYYPKSLDNPELAARIAALLPEKPPVTGTIGPDEEAWLETYELLSRSNLQTGAFTGFTEEELNTFLAKSQVLQCSQGQPLLLEGQGTKFAFIVLEGSVEVRRHGSPIAILQEGEMFGEFAFLLETKRTADVFANSPRVRLVVLNERTLRNLLASDPVLASKFLLNLSRTLALRLIRQAR